jgi:hypothetical protein
MIYQILLFTLIGGLLPLIGKASDDLALNKVKYFELTILEKGNLAKNMQATSIAGNKCQVRSLESYSKDLVVEKDSNYSSVLMNYFPSAKSWVLIARAFGDKPKYLTIYCFDVPLEFTAQEIEEDFLDAISFTNLSKIAKSDWIQKASKLLSFRPYFSLAKESNKLAPDFLVRDISPVRNNRSVLKFTKHVYPFTRVGNNQVGEKCGVTSLYDNNGESSYKDVGEYKIVNLDFNPSRGYLLIVGRNFFKKPMYAIIHCHNVDKDFTVSQLLLDLDHSLSIHKINRPHW